MSETREILKGIPDMPRAYSYLRFSRPEQIKGDSKRRQTKFAEEIAREEGFLLDDTLRLQDLGVSAFRGANAKVGELGRFLEAVETGRVAPGSVLIVESIDRLSRDKVGDALQLFIRILNNDIIIVTEEPRRKYTRESINDVAGLLEPIIYMSRAHEESKIKSKRMREVWGEKKGDAARERKPIGMKCPFWLTLTETGYQFKPKAEQTLQDIFRMAIDGLGVLRILQALEADPGRYHCFARSGRWTTVYLLKILRGRAVLGEYHPHKRGEDGKKVPESDPIPGYYPVAVDEDTWYRAQAAMRARTHHEGRPANNNANVFTGLLYDAVTRTRACLVSRRSGANGKKYAYLTPYDSAARGRPLGATYARVEEVVLAAVENMRPEDVQEAGRLPGPGEDEIARLASQLINIDEKLKAAERETLNDETTGEGMISILAVIKALGNQKKGVVEQLQILKEQCRTSQSENLGELRSLIRLLDETAPVDAGRLRLRIKARLRMLIEEAWMYVQPIGRFGRVVHVQLFLRGGRRHYLQVADVHSRWPTRKDRILDLSEVDLRQFEPSQAAAGDTDLPPPDAEVGPDHVV